MEVHKMKLNEHAVNLTIVLTLLTVAVYGWANGLNNVTLSISALIILGGLAHMLMLRIAALQPQQGLGEAVEIEQAIGS
jgi:hypothetical protein